MEEPFKTFAKKIVTNASDTNYFLNQFHVDLKKNISIMNIFISCT